MPRYIDAEKLKLSIIGLREGAIRNKQEVQVWALNACEFIVETADTADVEEVRHGEWIPLKQKKCWADTETISTNIVGFYCSECGAEEKFKYTYCHCGAKMDGKEKTDERAD